MTVQEISEAQGWRLMETSLHHGPVREGDLDPNRPSLHFFIKKTLPFFLLFKIHAILQHISTLAVKPNIHCIFILTFRQTPVYN